MDEGKTIVQVCMTGCRAYGSAEVKDALEEEAKKQGLSNQVEILNSHRLDGNHGGLGTETVTPGAPYFHLV